MYYTFGHVFLESFSIGWAFAKKKFGVKKKDFSEILILEFRSVPSVFSVFT